MDRIIDDLRYEVAYALTSLTPENQARCPLIWNAEEVEVDESGLYEPSVIITLKDGRKVRLTLELEA